MKHIGKIAALAMTLSLAFVLTACGGSASSSAASSASASSASAASASASASESSASAASESAEASSASAEAASASAEAASASAEAASASAEASSAAAENDLYTNAYFGIQFDLPEGWKFVNADELATLSEALGAATTGASAEMIAASAAGDIVTVNLQMANDETAGLDADAFLEKEIETVTGSITGDNVSTKVESGSITFKGIDRELPARIVNITNGESTYCIVEAIAEKDGNFLSIMSMGATEEAANASFSNFSSITA